MEYRETDLLVLRNLGKITTLQTVSKEIGYTIVKINFVLKSLVEKVQTNRWTQKIVINR